MSMSKKNSQEMARLLRCTALYFVRQVSQIFEVLRDFHRLFGSRNSRILAFSILSAIFTGACGPPEKLSLALVPCSNVLRMTVARWNFLHRLLQKRFRRWNFRSSANPRRRDEDTTLLHGVTLEWPSGEKRLNRKLKQNSRGRQQ